MITLLQRYREARGLSQSKLAVLSGLHHSTISYVESGKRNLSLATVEHISEALHLSPMEAAALKAAAIGNMAGDDWLLVRFLEMIAGPDGADIRRIVAMLVGHYEHQESRSHPHCNDWQQ